MMERGAKGMRKRVGNIGMGSGKNRTGREREIYIYKKEDKEFQRPRSLEGL